MHESHPLHFPLAAQSIQNTSLHWSCISSTPAAQKGCGCPARDNTWLWAGRRQGRKHLPVPIPRLLHILFLEMTAWYNCHTDNPSNMMGLAPWRHSNWSREVADGNVSSKTTMSLKKFMRKCVCPFETYFSFLMKYSQIAHSKQIDSVN